MSQAHFVGIICRVEHNGKPLPQGLDQTYSRLQGVDVGFDYLLPMTHYQINRLAPGGIIPNGTAISIPADCFLQDQSGKFVGIKGDLQFNSRATEAQRMKVA